MRDLCSKKKEKPQALYDQLPKSMKELHKRMDVKLSLTNMAANFQP